MKGFLDTTKGTLYIFPQEAGAIPYVDPEVTKIAVQPDEVIAFKEANELYANMIYPYNYWTMTVKAKVWAGHEDDDIEVPVTNYPEPTEEVEVQYTQWDGGLEGYTRFLDESFSGTPWYEDNTGLATYLSKMTIDVDSTTYQPSSSNIEDDMYWDDLTNKNVGVVYNPDTTWPDIYVKTSLSPQTVSLTYTPSQL